MDEDGDKYCGDSWGWELITVAMQLSSAYVV